MSDVVRGENGGEHPASEDLLALELVPGLDLDADSNVLSEKYAHRYGIRRAGHAAGVGRCNGKT
jgi:hypothetical protein